MTGLTTPAAADNAGHEYISPALQTSSEVSASTDNPGSTEKLQIGQFKFLGRLGSDNYGNLVLAESARPRALCAIRILKKEFLIENDEVGVVRTERSVYMVGNREQHPFMTRFYGCFQTEGHVFFATEYLAGGSLMTQLQRGEFGEARSRFYAAEICMALDFLHKKGIIYRNLSLESILLDKHGHIKMMDFGLCKENMWHGSTTNTFCGTAEFMAPEVLRDKSYGRPVDWWGFGVLLHQMLIRNAPFQGEDEDEIYDAILADEVEYSPSTPEDWVSILRKLMAKNPDERLGSGPTDAQEVMSQTFFQSIVWDDIYHKRVTPPFIPTISNEKDTSNFDSEYTSDTSAFDLSHPKLTSAMQEEFRGFDYTADFA